MGREDSDFILISSLPGSERAQALCDGKRDAVAYVVGHPSGTIKEASSNCDIQLLPVEGPAVDALLKAHPYYNAIQIPAGLYRGADEAAPSFGVRATLVTTASLAEETAYQLVKSVRNNFV